MGKSGRIVRYTKKEIEERIGRGEDRTDWARVDADAAPIYPSRTYADVPGLKEGPA